MEFVRASDTHPEFAAGLSDFSAEIKRIFEPQEIREYLETIRRTGPFGHIGTDRKIELMEKAGTIDENPVRDAEDALIIERIKEILLG